jgi:hypothetical protein
MGTSTATTTTTTIGGPTTTRCSSSTDEGTATTGRTKSPFLLPLEAISSLWRTKPRRWNALVQWDPHLFPPWHGYNILKDRQGVQRFIKSANLLPSNKPYHCPPKLRFAPVVGVKVIPRHDDPVNENAWDEDYHRKVENNRRWELQQVRAERAGLYRHRRLVVSSTTSEGRPPVTGATSPH